LYEAWHENGQQSWRIPYRDGKRDGLVKEWLDDGKIVRLTAYLNHEAVSMDEYVLALKQRATERRAYVLAIRSKKRF
jgi:hypothetical protein